MSRLAPVLEQAPPEARDFIRSHGKTILAAALAAVIAFAGSSAYRNYRASSAAAAQKLLFGKSPQEVEQAVSQYGSAPVAPLALMTLASMRYDSGDYDQAATLFTRFVTEHGQHAMVDRAKLNLALCLEASGKLDEALKSYEQFGEAHKTSYLYPESVFGRARCLEQQGKFSDAKAVYEDFIAGQPESLWRDRAESALPYLERSARAGGLPKPAANPLQFSLPQAPAAPSLPVPQAPSTPNPAPAP